MSHSPLVVTDTETLGRLADAILEKASNPRLTKNTVLNLIAAEIAGPKHNWGFLKGHDGPVIDRRLDPLSVAAALEEKARTKATGNQGFFCLEDGSLVVSLRDDVADRSVEIPVEPLELLAIAKTMIAPDAGGKPRNVFGTSRLTIERHGDMLRILRHLPGGRVISGLIPFMELVSSVKVMRGSVRQAILSTPEGEAVHDAFVSVAETDTEIAAAESAGRIIPAEIDDAVVAATILFFERNLSVGSLSDFRRRGTDALVNQVFDRDWPFLHEALKLNRD